MAGYKIRAYRTGTKKPVEDWLRTLPVREKAELIRTIDLLEEFGPALGLPHSRALGDGLLELRARTPEFFLRVIYFHWFGRTYGLLTGFAKKTNQTPSSHIKTAAQRRAEWLARPRPK